MALRGVISTLNSSGEEAMGPTVIMFRHPSDSIVNGTLLTVESNHIAVLKSRGAILQVYETGQYPIESPQRPIFGGIQQAFYGGGNP
ncbi:MAG: SPFH domain-containing protein, partial [Actinomycetota bacterium]|nr:SPFH domain-containing protein [Actinomycetota bacterium]